jgi:ABC-type nitrate/sulfonate/bicarbonate transport system ATPase subunit
VVVNYAVIGMAVFHGSFTHKAGTPGSASEDVSVASFYLIMLMSSLTSVLDATKQLGEIAGHTSRICNFMQQMESLLGPSGNGLQRRRQHTSPFTPRRQPSAVTISCEPHAGPASPTFVMGSAGGHGRTQPFRRVLSDTLNRRRQSGGEEMDEWHGDNVLRSAFGAMLPVHLKSQACSLLSPTHAKLADGFPMEISIHRLGTEELREIVGNVFPDVPLGADLLAVCTFQPVPATGPALLRAMQVRHVSSGALRNYCSLCLCCRFTSPRVQGAQLFSCHDVQVKEQQLGTLLQRYLAWESSVRANLQAHGFWCDSVDPQTALAMFSTQGAKYSEAIGAQIFLNYPVQNEGGCGVIFHPIYGAKTYPVTFFTTAPYVTLFAALLKACTINTEEQATWQAGALQDSEIPLLSVFDLTVSNLGDSHRGSDEQPRCAARNLTFEMQAGQHVLVHGSPGVGKSTLFNALRGLGEVQHGGFKWRPGIRALYVPQTHVTAPVPSLEAQVSYPEVKECSHEEATHLLNVVGLGYLPERGEKGEIDFATLSKGEAQCLGIARVLHAKPDLVMLDEALSAVPVETEMRLLHLLTQAGITLLMVSHRAEVHRVATSLLTIDPSLQDGWIFDSHVH